MWYTINIVFGKVGIRMQIEITVQEIEETINSYTNIEEPIIVKRKDKEDLVIISMEEYKKKLYLAELDKKLLEGEEDIINDNIYDARDVLMELREKYGY